MKTEAAQKWGLSTTEYPDNGNHSVRVLSGGQELDRRMADAAHRRWGEQVMRLESYERELAALFASLESATADMLKAGSRVEANWESLPLVNAAHTAWMSNRVGPAPIRTP